MNKLSKTTEAMRDDKLYPVVQITYLDKTVDAVVGNQYGIHTSPKKDSPAILLTFNNDEANRIIIPLSIKNRTKDLKENEVEVGNFEIGSIIKFDKDGNITITGKKDITLDITGNAIVNAASVTINCDTVINGNATVNGSITATGTVTTPTVVAGAVTASGAVGGGTVVAGGKDLETHKHVAGTYAAGGDAVSGESGEPA